MRRAAACLRLLSLFVSIIWKKPDFISIQGQTSSSSHKRAIYPPPREGSPRLRPHVHVHAGEPEFRCRGGVTLVLHQTLLVSFIVSPEGVSSIHGVFTMATEALRRPLVLKQPPLPLPEGGGTADRWRKANHLMDQLTLALAPVSVDI